MKDYAITKLFYLGLWCLTLVAAAQQWLPGEGIPDELEVLGAGKARAQSPGFGAPMFPTAPPTVADPAATQAYPPPAAAQAATFGAPLAPPNASLQVPAIGTPIDGPTQELEATRVVARVGSEVILAGDVSSSVNAYLGRNGVNPNDPEIAEQKKELFKMRLKQIVDTRIIVNEARRKIPEEGYKKAMAAFNEEFEKTVALKMAKERNLPGVPELEAALRKDGTTLDRERDNFAEAVLCNSWISQNTKVSNDVPHNELLEFYQLNASRYELVAMARWEQIMVRFDQFPSKAEAYAAIARAGNQVLDGTPFHQVAQAVSHGSTASNGGLQTWTKKGSLVSKELDQAIFTVPVNQLSPIIEDAKGFHIVRVLERTPEGRIPFTDVQGEIRKIILNQRMEVAKKELADSIRKKTPVWTIYDDQQPAVGTAATPTAMQR